MASALEREMARLRRVGFFDILDREARSPCEDIGAEAVAVIALAGRKRSLRWVSAYKWHQRYELVREMVQDICDTYPVPP